MKPQLLRAGQLSLRQLSYLVAISDTLNFTKAAEQCFVTQSTLSAGLAELERALGVCLVERDRQHVALSPIGKLILEQARGLLSASYDLIELAQANSDPAKGVLTLGLIPTIAPFLLGDILGKLGAAFPDLKLRVRESQTQALMAELAAGELDLAILALPIELGKLRALPLFDEALVLVAHRSDPLAKRKRLNLQNLDPQRLLLLEAGHCLRDHALAVCPAQVPENQNLQARQVEASHLATMVQLVNARLGCALLPEMAISAGLLRNTEVTTVPVDNPQPKRTIAMALRPTHPRIEFLQGAVFELLKGCRPSPDCG